MFHLLFSLPCLCLDTLYRDLLGELCEGKTIVISRFASVPSLASPLLRRPSASSVSSRIRVGRRRGYSYLPSFQFPHSLRLSFAVPVLHLFRLRLYLGGEGKRERQTLPGLGCDRTSYHCLYTTAFLPVPSSQRGLLPGPRAQSGTITFCTLPVVRRLRKTAVSGTSHLAAF